MNDTTGRSRKIMSANEVSRLMGSLDMRYYEEAEQALAAEQPAVIKGKSRQKAASFFNSGWFAACICAVAGIGVYVALLGLGKGWFGTPAGHPGTDAESAGESEPALSETTAEDTADYSRGLKYAAAAGGWTVKGIGSCTDTCLIIPTTYQGNPVVAVADEAFTQNGFITEVILPDSVTSIGRGAFSGCSQLTAVRMPENNETSIGDLAFASCPALKEMYLYDGTTCRPGVFEYDTGLKSIRFPDDMAEINNDMCCECTALETVILPSQLKKVQANAFLRCGAWRDVTLPETLVSVGAGAFAGCGFDLDTLRLPDSLIYIGSGAFDTLTLIPEFMVNPDGTAELPDGSPFGTYELYVDDVLVYVFTDQDNYTVREGTRIIAEGAITMFPEWNAVIKTVVLPDTLEYLCGESTSIGDFNCGHFNVVGEWMHLPVTGY